MWFGLVSLFPAFFNALDHGMPGRAQERGLITYQTFNPRDFTEDKHRTVDDKPYGGGPGMLMKVEPLQKALAAARLASLAKPRVIYLSPQGQPFTQALAEEAIAGSSAYIFLAGRYEGIDERLIDSEIDAEWSLGDFILSGGEIAALAIIDAIARLIPGVLGDAGSATQDTFSNGLLKYPQYTRPETIAGLTVPDILLSGDHQAIANWRLRMALGQTWRKRPDLLLQRHLNPREQQLLDDYINDFFAMNTRK